jgi:hypothetical protein
MIKLKLSGEMDVFNFSIEKNVISLLFEMTNAKGERVCYPSYAKFVEALTIILLED